MQAHKREGEMTLRAIAGLLSEDDLFTDAAMHKVRVKGRKCAG